MPSSDRTDREEYLLMRRAVRDAIWDVIEKLLTVFIVILLLTIGVAFTTQGFRGEAGGWLAGIFGIVLVIVAIGYFLREFDLLPWN